MLKRSIMCVAALLTLGTIGCDPGMVQPEDTRTPGSSFEKKLLQPDDRGDVYIDFILHLNDAGEPNNCVIIKTRGDEDVDVGGWAIGANGMYYTLPAGTVVPVGGRLVIHWNGEGTTDSDDVWTGMVFENFSQIEYDVILLSASNGRHVQVTPSRVVDYLRWDTDDNFGNVDADHSDEKTAKAAGLWDGTYVDVTGADFLTEKITLLNPANGPGVSGSDYAVQ